MADQNNDNVVFNNPGSHIPDQPMYNYPMQPTYNINPDGYAGYSNYITDRGDDSKYGAVPRFDALPYDQFQPHDYGQTSPYGGYPQSSQYGQPYPGQSYAPNTMPSGYGYGTQYPSDPYQQYDQIYDWQQSTGQLPQLRPSDPYYTPPSAPFNPALPHGYNTPRMPQGYDPYAQGERPGIELSDVVNDIIGTRGQSPQYQYPQTPRYPDNSGIYPEQSYKSRDGYTQMPTEYMPSGSFGPQDYSSRSAPPSFETAVFSLDDIQRQQTNSKPPMPDRATEAPSATTLDFNIPLDNSDVQRSSPQMPPVMPQYPAQQQASVMQQSPAHRQFDTTVQSSVQQQDLAMPQPSASQPQSAAQPTDSPFGQSFGETFIKRTTAEIPIQEMAPSQNAYQSAPDAALDFSAAFSEPSAPAQQQPEPSVRQFESVASDSDMDSLFGSVFNNKNSKSTDSDPRVAAPYDFGFSTPVQPATSDAQAAFPEQNSQPMQQPAAVPGFNAPHVASTTPPQPFIFHDALPQQNQSEQPIPAEPQFTQRELQPVQQISSGVDFYPNAMHTTLEQDFTATADFENNIFDSNFQINEPPKTEPSAAPTVRDTEIFRIAEELSQAVLIKSRSRALNDNNTMKEDNVRLVQVDGMSSDYYISEGGVDPYRMFENVSFGLNVGSCCALVCDVPLAAYVLARSICESADQDYEDEPVRVADTPDGEAGQMMYIGSDSMLPDEMNVEDFLLYTQTGSSDDENARERLRALLSQLGMSSIQDTDLRELSYNKRILLVTLASALNPNIVCIVINDPKFRVDAEEEMLARRVFSLVNNRGKCSLIACSSAYLMASVANRVAVLKRGRLEFFGEYKKFLDDYCLGIMSFNSDKPLEVTRQLEAKYPDLSVLCQEKLVYLVKKKDSPDIDLAALIKDVINLGADYNSIVMDEKSFVMACKEALGKG